MQLTFIVWLLLATIWGTTWLFIKIGLNADLPPFTFAASRFILALIPLVIILLLQKKSLPSSRSDLGLILWTGLLTFSINYGLAFWGTKFISSGLTAILATTIPLFGLVLAHLFIKNEKMTLPKVLGVVLGIGGVALLFIDQIGENDIWAPLGSLAIILSALGAAASNTIVKARGTHLDPVVLTTGQIAVGLLPLLVIALLVEGNPAQHNWNIDAVLSVVYLAFIGTSLTFALLYWLIQRIEVTKTQLVPFWSTLVAVFLGWIVLNEQLHWNTFAGGATILLGLAVAIWRRKAPEARDAPESESA